MTLFICVLIHWTTMEFPTLSVVGGISIQCSEALPHDAHISLGKHIILIYYVDTSFFHCVIIVRSLAGIIHFLRGAPIDWFSKSKQRLKLPHLVQNLWLPTYVWNRSLTCISPYVILVSQLLVPVTCLRTINMLSTVPWTVMPNFTKHTIPSHFVETENVLQLALANISSCIVNTTQLIFFLNNGYIYKWQHVCPLLFWDGDTSDIPSSFTFEKVKREDSLGEKRNDRTCK